MKLKATWYNQRKGGWLVGYFTMILLLFELGTLLVGAYLLIIPLQWSSYLIVRWLHSVLYL